MQDRTEQHEATLDALNHQGEILAVFTRAGIYRFSRIEFETKQTQAFTYIAHVEVSLEDHDLRKLERWLDSNGDEFTMEYRTSEPDEHSLNSYVHRVLQTATRNLLVTCRSCESVPPVE